MEPWLIFTPTERPRWPGKPGDFAGGVMTKVLTKMAYWNPDLDFDVAMDSLPDGIDLTMLKERIKPVISSIDEIKRVEGQRRD